MTTAPLVGLTGGIGSGKSAATRCFEALGVLVVDADVVARDLVEPGTTALSEITEVFGKLVLDGEGRLDREALRNIVFADDKQRARLQEILHPRIFPEMLRRAEGSRSGYTIMCVPLLVESGHCDRFWRILVVDCPQSLQIERVTKRDYLTEQQARAIMRTQASRERRLARADDVVHNDRDLEYLDEQIRELHTRYLKFSSVQS